MIRTTAGVHIVVVGSHDYYGKYLRRCAEAGHPVGMVKSVFDGGALGQAKADSPQTTTIYRVSIDDDDFPSENWNWPNSAACIASAQHWMSECDKLWNQHRAYVDYFELVNEPNMATLNQVDWFIEWCHQCSDIALEMGYKLGVGGFSTGCPPLEHMDAMLYLMKENAERGHILTVHDGPIDPPQNFQQAYGDGMQPSAVLRYRFWKAKADAAGFRFPRVAITEGYAYARNQPWFYSDLAWYLAEMARDDYCLGFCWYTLGDGSEYGNIAGKPLQKYTDMALAIDWDSITPPAPPISPDPLEATTVKIEFVSQLIAPTWNACGPACAAMLEKYLTGSAHTVEQWWIATGAAPSCGVSFAQMEQAANAFDYHFRIETGRTIEELGALLDSGVAPILLVNGAWLNQCATHNAHYIICVGDLHNGKFLCHDPYLIGGNGGPMILQVDLENAWYQCVPQGNPNGAWLILEAQPVQPPPISAPVVLGVGMGDLAIPNQDMLDMARIARVDAVKVLTLPDPDDNRAMVAAIRRSLGDVHILARLFFSPNAENESPFPPSAFVETIKVGALALYGAGVREFEVHNEPNLIYEGCYWNWETGKQFAQWFIEVRRQLKLLMPDALLGFPGLSPGDAIYNVRENCEKFWMDASSALVTADFICCHSYWQNSIGMGYWAMDDVSGGMSWMLCPTDSKVVISEFSNNLRGVSPAIKGEQYAQYLSLLAETGVVSAAYAFALSWQSDQNGEAWYPSSGALSERLGQR